MKQLGGLVLVVGFQGALMGNPTGGQVAAGAASINTVPGTVTINQASKAAIINWQSFSINQGELTQFIQPSSTSAVLNRVLGGQTSTINGQLSANGQVYLINGNGIVVGQGGVINTGSFTASTRDISDADFLSGNLHFLGSSSGGVQNLGKITALGGDAVLIGKTVDNQGSIRAPHGMAGLLAGDDILLAQKNADGSTMLVRPSTSSTSASSRIGVQNSGTITAAAAELKAANGNIYALAIQNKGLIRATTGHKEGGRVWLTTDSNTIVNSGIINVSALRKGRQGGSVILKSDTGTVAHSGQIIAHGGLGGSGGGAEISGESVRDTGLVDLTALGGKTGTLLIDPTTWTIATTGGDITPAAVVTALATANVIYSATSHLTVTDAINASGNADAHSLTFDAPTIDLNQKVTLGTNEILLGTGMTINVGANGLVQNGIDVASATTAATLNLANTTYTLTGSQLVINKSLMIEGNGAILNANNASRVLEIDGSGVGVTVTLDDLTLENGNGVQGNKAGAAGPSLNAFGGGILIYAENGRRTNVTLENSTVTANKVNAARDGGGGIDNDGANSGSAMLTVTNSVISYNVAVLQAEISADSTLGGGIYNDAENSGTANLSITAGSILTYNTADTTTDGLYGSGGAIFNDAQLSGSATVTIDDSMITHNTSDYGAGIYNNSGNPGTASLNILDHSVVSNNHAEQNGGALFNDHAAFTISDSTLSSNRADYVGGVMETSGPLEMITNTTMANNSAAYGGGAIYHDGSSTATADDLVLTGCTFTGNTTGNFGGAICNDGGGIDFYGTGFGLATCEITGCNFSGNLASQGAAVINYSIAAASVVTVTGSTFTGNGNASTADGGAIYNRGSGTLNVDSTTISNNMANIGGGLMNLNGAKMTVTNSLISGNSATIGGGIYYGAGIIGSVMFVTVKNNTISGNSAVNGGGIFTVGGGTSSIIDNTVRGNMATNGGGIYNSGNALTSIINDTITGNSAVNGGGIYNGGTTGVATAQITESTIVGNTATGLGAGIDNISTTGPVKVKLDSTILSNNTIAGLESDYFQAGAATLISQGYNLYGQNGNAGGFTGATTGDILLGGNINTVLSPLATNGGPTQTMALIAGSPALNAGDPANTGTTDQRGIIRGSTAAYTGSAPDIGAYEAQFASVRANQTTSYGTALPSPLPYVVTNGPANSASLLSGAVVVTTPETNAGVYVGDIGKGTLAISGTTYLLDFIPGTLTINPVALTITANNATKTYDGIAYSGGNGVSYSGFMYGENSSVLGGSVIYGGTSQGAINAGTYTISLSGPTSNNYTIFPVTGSLTIDPRAAAPPLGPFPQFDSGFAEYERRRIELFPGDGDADYLYAGNWKSGLKVILEMSSANVK